MLYEIYIAAILKRHGRQMEEAEMIMPRSSLGVTRKDKIRNDHIRATSKVDRFGYKVRHSILIWCGLVKRRECDSMWVEKRWRCSY